MLHYSVHVNKLAKQINVILAVYAMTGYFFVLALKLKLSCRLHINTILCLLPVPRILFDGWSGNDYHAMFSTEDIMLDCVSTIVKYVLVCFTVFTRRCRHIFLVEFTSALASNLL